MTKKTTEQETDRPFGSRPPRVSVGVRSNHKESGESGATIRVFAGTKYPKHYHVLSHGKTTAEVVAEVAEIEAKHAIKEEKLDGLAAAHDAEFSIGSEQFRVTCATVMERGTDSELVLNVSRLDGERWVRMEGMPIRRVVGHVSNVPDAAGAIAVATAFATSWAEKQGEHAAFTAELTALLGEGST